MKAKNGAGFKALNIMTCIAIPVVVLLVVYVLFSRAMGSITTEFISSTQERYIIFFVMCIITFLAVISKWGFRVFLSIWVSLFLFIAVYDLGYSPVDEGAHFATINYIVSHKRLPTTYDGINSRELNEANNSLNNVLSSDTNYEAVQAPAYYLCMAFVGWFVRNMTLRLRVLRLLSFFMMLVGVYYIKKSIDVLSDWKLYKTGEGRVFLRLLSLVTVFSPGYLLRAGHLNNETLLCLLIPLLMYIGIRCLKDGYSPLSYWLMSGVCFACFMTKNTALYVYAVIGIIAIYQKKIHKAILPVLAGVPLIIPWLIFNYNSYGHLTGMSQHIEYVMEIVNPTNQPIDLFESFLSYIWHSFWGGEDISFTDNVAMIAHAVYLIGVTCLIVLLIKLLQTVFNRMRNKERIILPAVMQVNMVCLVLLIAAFIMLSVGAIGTRLPSLRGRYFHGTAVALIMIGVVNLRFLPKSGRIVLSIMTGVLFGALSYSSIEYIGKLTCTEHHLFASKVNSIEKADITDGQWNNGISYDGTKVRLLPGTGYGSLQDRIIEIGSETRVVGHVNTDNNAPYLELNPAIKMLEDGEASKIQLKGFATWKIINERIPKHKFLRCEKGTVFSQTYLCPAGTELYGVEFSVGTEGKVIPEIQIEFSIIDGSGNYIYQSSSILRNVEDLSVVPVYFEKPITSANETDLMFEFKLNYEGDNYIFVPYTKKDNYKAGSLCVNGENRESNDLEFAVLSYGAS